jgi:hypothetical protein
MSKIYLLNIGANNSHHSSARSPRFADGSFVYVPFPWEGEHARQYPGTCAPFIRTSPNSTHDDPDWPNLTYGDDCGNGRAGNLRSVREGDILLYWSLLWDNAGNRWTDFTGQKGWYLIGALRVAEILTGGQRPTDARPEHTERAQENVHFGSGPLPPTHRVFIGDPRYSTLFGQGVDLQGDRKDGLVYRTMGDKNGNPLLFDATAKWYSYLRTCRAMWDLDVAHDRRLARIVRDSIGTVNDFDLLADV